MPPPAAAHDVKPAVLSMHAANHQPDKPSRTRRFETRSLSTQSGDKRAFVAPPKSRAVLSAARGILSGSDSFVLTKPEKEFQATVTIHVLRPAVKRKGAKTRASNSCSAAQRSAHVRAGLERQCGRASPGPAGSRSIPPNSVIAVTPHCSPNGRAVTPGSSPQACSEEKQTNCPDMHIITSLLFVSPIPLQFAGALRRRYPGLHRWSGRIIMGLGSRHPADHGPLLWY